MYYKIINIRDFYKDEESTVKILSHFKCDFNPDIEKFLIRKINRFF